MGTVLAVALTTFLASAVEAIEMVAIVTGVGATRGWRSALAGAAAGFAVLVVVVAIFGLALTAIPIGALRLIVGYLLVVFGLNWLRKGLRRVSTYGLRGRPLGEIEVDETELGRGGVDWTGFVLSFKGVLLEGLEVAFIVVTFGVTGHQLGVAAIGGVTAVVVVGGIGLAIQPVVRRIPRSVLQLVVGLLLTTFGTFWAVEGVGIDWPGTDLAIVGLLVVYSLLAAAYIAYQRSLRTQRQTSVVAP
jgi:Ca2+/H+ antiporter, TMEM165/GDT1 family